jgi:diguanylate cyclase (GGDEF)-like protein
MEVGLPVAVDQTVAPAPARILLVEEDPCAATLISEMLRAVWRKGLLIVRAERLQDATQELLDHGASCVLLDLPATDRDRLDGLEHMHTAAPDVPIIVLCDQASEAAGLQSLEAGAQDHLLKSELDPTLLSRAVRYAIQRKRSEVELAHQALHDPLTGLPNRALFLDRLSVALDRCRRASTSVAVLFLDVDSFKQINDSLGHAAGDQVLVALAERLHEMLRPMDTVARFGGDEFTLLFEDLESEREAVLIAERISRSASIPVSLGESETSITVSLGIAIVQGPVSSPDQLIRDADTAMYRAKELGGARLELFDESSRQRASQRLELESALRQAIERSELRVHYQPTMSLNGETKLIGFEALVRWEHPERGLIAPSEFMAIAEDTGLIVPIGDYVLEQAMRQVGRWRESWPGVTMSVNLSTRQLQDPGLASRLARLIDASGTDPGALCLEVTEDSVEHNPELAARMLGALKTVGVRLALDDFGNGYSSLSSLRKLPIDMLKIHQSFVRGLGNGSGDDAILGAVVELGHALGLNVVAEGVETDVQLAELRDLGCDGAQGYLFGRPVTEDEAGALLRAG